MIIFNILLVFLTGLLLLWIFDQHKFLNIFEQLAFGFGVALSLFVFELFFEGIVFNHLSLILPVLTFLVLLGIVIYRNIKTKTYFSEIFTSIKMNLAEIKSGFNGLKTWQKVVSILIIIYTLFKIFMVFSINTHMPTFDEDAVAGWDMKTKVFVENRSLVLDKGSSEFLGSDYGRFPWAGITDTYFLLSSDKIIGLTNIISPLLYLLGLFLIFGILIRKTNLFNSSIFSFVYCSLPFLFIHGFGSYWNYAFGIFIFIFTFYFLDQIIQSKLLNKNIIYLLSIFGFLIAGIRNEGFLLLTLIFALLYIYNIYLRGDIKNYKKYFNFSLYIFIGILLVKVFNSILLKSYPVGSDLNMGGIELGFSVIPKFFASFFNSQFFKAPFEQAFFHSDYNILYLVFSVYLLYFLFNYKKNLDIIPYIILFFILLSIFIFFLFVSPALGLITHFAFIRYTLALFLIILIICGLLNNKIFDK